MKGRVTTPYRTRKVRILNGAHTSLVPVAYPAGLRTVRESVDDAKIGKYLKDVVFEEIIPTLESSGERTKAIRQRRHRTFSESPYQERAHQIALNSVSKFKVRVLSSLLQYITVKKSPPHLPGGAHRVLQKRLARRNHRCQRRPRCDGFLQRSLEKSS